MKTTSITVERNFHIMNEDRFLMEKISVVIELENDDTHDAIDKARNLIERNFKVAYPNVHQYLNFYEVIQVKKNEIPVAAYHYDAIKKTYSSGAPPFVKLPDEPEQKEWYTQEGALENIRKEIGKVKFKGILEKVYAPMIKNYPELQELYNEKLSELQKQTV